LRLSIDPKTQRSEWLEGRRKGLGSSDVPAIVLPESQRPKYMSPWKVWRSKVQGVDEEVSSLFVDFGNIFERAVGDHIASETGKILRAGGWYQSESHPWMMASPDFWLGVHRPEGLECKVIQNAVNASEWMIHSAPPHVTVQSHWCMMVTDVDRWHIGALLWYSQEIRHYTIERDRAFEAKILDRAQSWWERHVIGGEPPPMDSTAACGSAILDRNRRSDGRTREANESEEKIIAEWLQWRDARKLAESQEKRSANILKSIISGNRAINSQTVGRVTWGQCAGKKSIDQKRLREERPEIFDEFTKQGQPYRRLTHSKPKG